MIEILWLVLFGVFSFVSGGCVIALYRNRHTIMIKKRKPGAILLQLIAGFVLVSMICWREYDRSSFPCALYIVIINLFTPLYFLPMFHQAFSLDLLYTFTTKSLSQDNYKINYTQAMKKRDGFTMVIASVIFFVHIAVMGGQLMVASGEADLSEGCQWADETEFIILGVFSALYAVGFGLVMWKLRNVQDEFEISHNLRLSFCWALIMTSIFLVLNMVPGLWFLDDIVPFSLVILVMIIGLHVLNIIRPLYICTGPKYELLINRMGQDNALDYKEPQHYMRNQLALNRLTEFCKERQQELIKQSPNSIDQNNNNNNITSSSSSSDDLDVGSIGDNNALQENPMTAIRPQLALQIYVTLYRYLKENSINTYHDAKAVIDFINEYLDEDDLESITIDQVKAVKSVLTAEGVPTRDQLRVYYDPLSNYIKKVCIEPFVIHSDGYANLLVDIQRNTEMCNLMQTELYNISGDDDNVILNSGQFDNMVNQI
jgi:hypothetical protein